MWREENMDDIRALVASDREHLLAERAELDDTDPLKSLGDEEYLEAKAQSYVGRVRKASFMMFTTREPLPQEVQYLRAAESLIFMSNANTFLIKSLSTGEYLNNLPSSRGLP